MVLPPPVVWKDLGLVNSMDEPFSEENCIDLRNYLIYRTVADKVDMLRANFPGETVEQAVSRADKLMYQAKNRKNMVVTEDNARDGALSAAGRESHSRQSILIVDDSEMNRAILAEILGSDYNILEATNGRECLAMLEQYGTGIALILLDIVMPVMDGFAVLSEMNRSHWIEDIPVIMISSEDADTVVRRAYELGVSDYVSRPFDAGIVYRRGFNTIKLYAKQRRLASLVTSQIKEKEKNTKMMISILSEVVEFRNGESGQHVLHIGTLTQRHLERLTQKTDKSSRFVMDENYISGESFSIGYEFTQSFVRKLGLSALSVQANMNDAFRISSVKNERGIDYPFARTISFSVAATF